MFSTDNRFEISVSNWLLLQIRGSGRGLIREGGLFKIQDQGYKKLARDVEERTGQESFDSQAHEIRNWQDKH